MLQVCSYVLDAVCLRSALVDSTLFTIHPFNQGSDKTNIADKFAMLISQQGLCEDIGMIVLGMDFIYGKCSISNLFSNVMILDVNVFSLFMKDIFQGYHCKGVDVNVEWEIDIKVKLMK